MMHASKTYFVMYALLLGVCTLSSPLIAQRDRHAVDFNSPGNAAPHRMVLPHDIRSSRSHRAHGARDLKNIDRQRVVTGMVLDPDSDGDGQLDHQDLTLLNAQMSGVAGDGIPDVYYFAKTGRVESSAGPIVRPGGVLTLDTDGVANDIVAILVGGPNVLADCDLCAGVNLPTQSPAHSQWTVGFSGGSSQWIRTSPLSGDGFKGVIGTACYDAADQLQSWPADGGGLDFPEAGLADYGPGLAAGSFDEVFSDGVDNWSVLLATDAGGQIFTNVTVIDEPVMQTCGNGVLEPGEQCDDSNLTPGDGCNGICLIEVGADNCGGAATISEGLTGFSTIGATTDGSPDPLCGNAGTDDIGQDIWFNYTAPASGELTVSTCEQLGGSADFDTRIAVYPGCGCPPGSAVACNDDDPANECGTGAGGFHSTATVPVSAGTCYDIRVGGFGTAEGTGTLLLDLQQYGDPDYTLSMDAPGAVYGEPGSTVEFTANVQLTVADGAESVGGFSLGVAHDGPGVCEILQGVQGPALTALNGGAGPDFASLQLPAGGFTAGAVFSFDGLAVLQSGVHTLLELTVEATIPPSGCANCSLDIVGTLGMPTVSVVVVVNGTSFGPGAIDSNTAMCSQVPVAAAVVAAVGQEVSGSPGEVVTSLNAPTTNGRGQVGFTGSIDFASDTFVWYDDDVVWRNSDALPDDSLSGAEPTMGIGDDGVFVYSPSVNGNDAVWGGLASFADLILAEGDEIYGAYPTFNSRPSMTPDGTAHWIAGLAASPGGSTAGRVLFSRATSSTAEIEIVQVTGDVVDGFTIAEPAGLDFDYQVADNRAHRIHMLFLETGSSLDDAAISVDSLIVARESMPTGEGDNWSNFDVVTINNAGHYLFSGDTDGNTLTDEFIAYDGAISIREGDVLDGVALTTGANVRALSINNLGIAVHLWGIAGGVSEKVLFVGEAANLAATSRKLLAIGDPVDVDADGIPDATVDDLKGSSISGPALSLAEDSHVYVEVELIDVGDTQPYEAILRVPLGFDTPCGSTPCSPVLYVDALAPPGGYGQSWDSAFQHLQDALAVARATHVDGASAVFSEIRVAQGTYRPDRGTGSAAQGSYVQGTLDQTASFRLADNLVVRGGFCGLDGACADPDDRDVQAYETVLSGDLLDDDDWSASPDLPTGTEDNCTTIVATYGVLDAGLDGLTLTRAYTETAVGALQVVNSTIAVNDCRFHDNLAYAGGGSYVQDSTVSYTDCTFKGNSARQGGGINLNGGVVAEVRGCRFDSNYAGFGGGIGIGAGLAVGFTFDAVIEDCLFTNNLASAGAVSSAGGGVLISPQIYLEPGEQAVVLRNNHIGPGNVAGRGGGLAIQVLEESDLSAQLVGNMFEGNEAVTGGGMTAFNEFAAQSVHIDLTSSTFTGNHATEAGGGLWAEGLVAGGLVEVQASNLLMIDNTADVSAGGAGATGAANLFVASSTLADNNAPSGAGIGFDGAVLAFYNSIAWANPGGDIEAGDALLFDGWSAIFGEAGDWPGLPGVWAVDPLFTDAANGDYSLDASSPAIDVGHNGLIWTDILDLDDDGDTDEPLPFDLAGDARVSDDIGVMDAGQGAAPIVDLGAFERTAPSCSALVAYDAFDNGVLDTRWGPMVTGGVTWVAEESAGRLLVTDFVGVPLMSSGTAVLALDIPSTGDFTLEAEVSWDSEGNVAAMQRVLVSLYGANTLVGEAGLVDGWLGSAGGYRIVAGDSAAPTLPDTAPLFNDTVFTIQRRNGTTVDVYENGALVQSGHSSTPVDRLQLYFQHDNFVGSLFGTVEIHRIQLTADPVADCNDNGLPDECDIAGGNALDEDGNGVPDECAGGACVNIADCADLDEDGIRDDNCMWWSCAASACMGTDIVFGDMAGQFGACPPDGTADGNDRFAALNCFANTDPNAPSDPFPCEADAPVAFNVDAGGQFGSCAPDGVCDGNDAFAALNAFAGTTSCSCPLNGGPSPVIEPVTVATATLELHASRAEVRPGDVIDVEVHLATPLADLRGYQLHLEVSGGDRGVLELVDIAIAEPGVFGDDAFESSGDRRPAIDDRRAARAARHVELHAIPRLEVNSNPESAADTGYVWAAFNTTTGQMLAGRDTPGVPVEAGYLATFTYRASKDARGSFAIDVLADPDAADHRTYLFPTVPGARIAIDAHRGVLVDVH